MLLKKYFVIYLFFFLFFLTYLHSFCRYRQCKAQRQRGRAFCSCFYRLHISPSGGDSCKHPHKATLRQKNEQCSNKATLFPFWYNKQTLTQTLHVWNTKKRQKKSLLKCCIQMQIQKTWDELRWALADIQSAAFQLWIKRLFCIWWLFLLPWSTEAKQYLLVVSLGMFLEKEQKQQVRHAAWQNKLYCKSLMDQRQVRKFTCHNSLLQRLPKAGLVFRADFSQVHLTAWHNNSGHHLLFGPFTLRKRAQVST